jgi:hypothetical protein
VLQAVGGMFQLLSDASKGFTGNDSQLWFHHTPPDEKASNASGDKNDSISFYVQFSQKQKISCGGAQIVQLQVIHYLLWYKSFNPKRYLSSSFTVVFFSMQSHIWHLVFRNVWIHSGCSHRFLLVNLL